MKNKTLILLLLVGITISGCSTINKALFDDVEQVEKIQNDDGSISTVTNIVSLPKYQNQLESTRSIASLLDPTGIANWSIAVLCGMYGFWNQQRNRKLKGKNQTILGAIVEHGDEAIKLLNEVTDENDAPEKLKGAFKKIQKRAEIYEDVRPYLQKAKELEAMARVDLKKQKLKNDAT